MDKGPWRACYRHRLDRWGVESDDTGVELFLEGLDGDAERHDYCQWLADVLNAASKSPATTQHEKDVYLFSWKPGEELELLRRSLKINWPE